MKLINGIKMIGIKNIQENYLNGAISTVDAVNYIDRAINGISRVDYQEGLRFKISNHTQKFALSYNGLKKKQISKLHALAVAAYFKAQENGSILPGEVHISKETSTKHHIEGINDIMERYQRQIR